MCLSFVVYLAKDFLTFAFMLSMRPIHRPIHDLAILPDVWDKMTIDEQTAARAKGKIRFPVGSFNDVCQCSCSYSYYLLSSQRKNS
jgi:hypothetical protein